MYNPTPSVSCCDPITFNNYLELLLFFAPTVIQIVFLPQTPWPLIDEGGELDVSGEECSLCWHLISTSLEGRCQNLLNHNIPEKSISSSRKYLTSTWVWRILADTDMADPTVILHWFDVDIKPIYMFVCFCILMPWSGRMFFWQKSVLLSVEVIVILC